MLRPTEFLRTGWRTNWNWLYFFIKILLLKLHGNANQFRKITKIYFRTNSLMLHSSIKLCDLKLHTLFICQACNITTGVMLHTPSFVTGREGTPCNFTRYISQREHLQGAGSEQGTHNSQELKRSKWRMVMELVNILSLLRNWTAIGRQFSHTVKCLKIVWGRG